MDKRINEIAIEHCKEYPDVKNKAPFEQLYAIECTLIGIEEANKDCHKFINYLINKIGMTKDEAASEWGQLCTTDKSTH